MKYALLTLAAVAAASTPSASAAMAHTEDSLRAHVAKSDLVFVGTVTDVSYAPSLEQRNGQGIPHTFVTYEVEKVLQGTAEDKDVTLRLLVAAARKRRSWRSRTCRCLTKVIATF